jgi:hypothetical protein
MSSGFEAHPLAAATASSDCQSLELSCPRPRADSRAPNLFYLVRRATTVTAQVRSIGPKSCLSASLLLLPCIASQHPVRWNTRQATKTYVHKSRQKSSLGKSLAELVLTLCWCYLSHYYRLMTSLLYHSLPAELLAPRAIAPDGYRP